MQGIGNFNKSELIEIIKNISKLPPVKLKTVEERLKELGMTTCRISGKPMHIKDLYVFNTGAIDAVNRVHPSILSDIPKDYCKVVCAACKEVVLMLEPGVNNRGFKLVPYKTYHIMDCPVCNPDKYNNKTVECRLIEEIYWSKHNPATIVNFSTTK